MPGRDAVHFKPPRSSRGLVVPTVRVLTGGTWSGVPRTDATFTKPGTGHYDPDQAGWWEHQPGRRRVLLVWSVPVTVVFCTYGYLTSSIAVKSTMWLASWLGIVWLLWTLRYEAKRWEPKKKWAEPIHQAIYADLKIPRRRSAPSYIHVPRGGEHINDPDKPLVIELPEYAARLSDDKMGKLALRAAKEGGILVNDQQMQADWQVETEPRTLTIRCDPQPPEYVPFEKVAGVWRDVAPDEIVFGLAHDGRPVVRSLDTDAPHILLSVGPGGGKTEFCCSLALQRMARGARIIYLDIGKRGLSSKWAKPLERSDFAFETIRQVEPAYQTILAVYDELLRRADRARDDDTGTYEPQETWLIFDEAPEGFAMLQRYERELRRDDKDAPSAVEAYQGIGRLGREPRIHLCTVAQRASHKATGGGDIRETHGIIIGGRGIRPNTARMLFEGVGNTLPRFSNHPGRYQVATGGHIEEFQGPKVIGPKPLKPLLPKPLEFVLTAAGQGALGAPPAAAATVRPSPVAVLERPIGDDVVVDAELIDPTPVEPEVVDLRTAAERLRERGYAITLAALRNYRGKPDTRDEFKRAWVKREHGTDFYDLAILERFLANRPRRAEG